ncbi:MAG: DnaJ domain-containing protein [Dehalococcoidia bacterium]|nr:DnaJ domain-containing protein [Dehalococcoidia bacterium]
MEDLYRVLQVRPEADDEALTAAHVRLQRRYDPAAGGPFASEAAWQRVEDAYATLSDPVRRRDYDTTRPRGLLRSLLERDRPRQHSGRAESAQEEQEPKTATPAGTTDPWSREPPSQPPRAPEAPFPASRSPATPGVRDPFEAGLRPQAGAGQVTEQSAAGDEAKEASGQSGPDAAPRGLLDRLGLRSSRSARGGHEGASETDDGESTPAEQDLAGTPAPPDRDTREIDTRALLAQSRAEPSPFANLDALPVDKESGKAEPEGPSIRTATKAGGSAPAATDEPAHDPFAAPVQTHEGERDLSGDPPPWRRIGVLGIASVALVFLGAGVAFWGVWTALDRTDDGSPGSASEAGSGTEEEEAADDPGPGELDGAGESEGVTPPRLTTAAALPDELRAFAETSVAGYEGPGDETYDIMDVVATQDGEGRYFYAAVGLEAAGGGGSTQRVFFFIDESFLGTDWYLATRSIESAEALAEGTIRIAYRAYGEGDDDCCPGLEPVVVTFESEGGFRSDNANPPESIFAD